MMMSETEKKLIKVMEVLLDNITFTNADDTLVYTQASLNMAHALQVIAQVMATKNDAIKKPN